jgi:hypothetical protein
MEFNYRKQGFSMLYKTPIGRRFLSPHLLDLTLSPSFPERTQNRVHEIGIVPDVLEFVRLG